MKDWRNCIWASVDTETTGTDPEVDRVVEFGVSLYHRTGGFLSRHHSRVNPGIPISEEATKVHGIADCDVVDKPKLIDLAGPICEVLSSAECIIGYNIYHFDQPILEREFAESWETVSNGLPVIDVLAIIRMSKVGRFWKGTGRHRLKSVAERFQVQVEKSHAAIDDSDTTAEVLKELITRFRRAMTIIPQEAAAAEEYLRRINQVEQERFKAWLAQQPPQDQEEHVEGN